MNDKIDFQTIGLKYGVEIHQRLATTRKLFCSCPARISIDQPIGKINRKLRAVAGELGLVDMAAAYEFIRNRTFTYHIFDKETCLVDIDEEPPHSIDPEAVRTTLELALLLKADIPGEIHVMRKTVIDGSNTSGFQRTAIIGLNGVLSYANKKIFIPVIAVEEESAGIVENDGDNVTYRLDRLGIPLVEISTGLLEGLSPKDAVEIAYHIGMLVRSTGKVLRGIGTIRQDVNVSIEGGNRVEIKGVQTLDLIEKAIEYEAQRQLTLKEIKNELKNRGCKLELFEKPQDVTNIFAESKSKFVKKLLGENNKIYAFNLSKFGSLLKKELCPGKTFGKELSEYAIAQGVGGMAHTDEDMTNYQMDAEMERVKALLSHELEDCTVIIAGHGERPIRACNAVMERCKAALFEIPREVRAANEDGTTKFSRPLPGSSRLYPETDIPPFRITKDLIEETRKHIPETWDKKLGRFTKMGLGKDLSDQIVRSEYLNDFENIIKNTGVSAKFVASVLMSSMTELRREGVKIEKINEEKMLEIFKLLEAKKIGKEAVNEVLKGVSKYPMQTVDETISKLGLKMISKDELKVIIKEIVQKNASLVKKDKKGAVKKLMGTVMKQVRGKIDGKLVNEILTDEIKKVK
ncbi:MAG: Glu-tRNA(Gln) amidotransferase subunit GatE [Candidatus Aenigmarchaeota archaeon]|nr:Glu-tRNA(Gln) amidotransferase subunit GatE [Candidatus Aenigmarchaeota archaeon]